MLYCLYENTHTCLLKRESGTLGDGSSSSGTTFPFGGEWSELLVLLSDFLTVRSYKCVMTLEQHRAPVTKFRIIMVQHEREKVSFLATCKGGFAGTSAIRWPRTRWCASRRCVRTARAVRSARAQEERGAAFGGPPHPVAKLAGFHPRGWRSPPERPRRDTARHRRMAVTLRGMEAEKSARDRTRTRRVPEGRAMCRTFSP